MNYIENTLSNDAFSYLRDQQHLGYIANSGITTMHKVDAIYFYVQGSTKDPGVMDEKIEEFIKILREKYEAMDEKDYPGYYLPDNIDDESEREAED